MDTASLDIRGVSARPKKRPSKTSSDSETGEDYENLSPSCLARPAKTSQWTQPKITAFVRFKFDD
jgi:hypothetical protein